MPDKRQESKQRRAARNRANREALAARRDNAVTSPPPRSSTSSGKGGAASGRPPKATANGATSNGGPGGPPAPGISGWLQRARPGDIAVPLAFVLAVVFAIYLLFYQMPADDRGEPLPSAFRGLAIAARERVTGQPMPDNEVSLLDASGPQVLLVLALPVAVTLFALWGNRRPDRSRMLTFAMLAMAGVVILTPELGIFFFPALIALAVGGFRVRKADLPARTAERATAAAGRGGRGRGRDDVIDAASEEVTDERTDVAPRRSLRSLWGPAVAGRAAAGEEGQPDDTATSDADDVVATGHAEAPDEAGDVVEAGAAAGDEPDPLAELEAEIEAERAAEGWSGDEDEPGGTGR